MASGTCMIFVDDSNVWIEAQKFAASGNSHMPKLQDSDRDPRLRIDIGKLVKRLREDRIQGPSFLYGSRPPPNDSVWQAFRSNKFETNIYDRAQNGKEKEVDNFMSTGMTKMATELWSEAKWKAELIGDTEAAEKKDNTTFVVVTGDRDMMPAVKQVLEYKIRVELWGWKSGISQAYLDLAANHGLLSVQVLDSIFKDISFTAYRSTRKVTTVVGGRTMVLRDIRDDEREENALCDRLLATKQLFWRTRWPGEPDLAIESSLSKPRQLLPEITIVSWPEYRARCYNKDPTHEDVKTVNRYQLLGAEDDNTDDVVAAKIEDEEQKPPPKNTSENTSGSGYNSGNGIGSNNDNGNDAGGSGGWKTVFNKTDTEKRHRRLVNQKQDCPFGLQCRKRDDCGYLHSEQERKLFQQNPDRGLGQYKTQPCHYAPYCTKGHTCSFAHSEDEARCLDCKQVGHYRNSAKCVLR
ncbi:hypothetical protein QBC34DRAFT_493973 [Podospora aff. communis PSN243]|uniref:C3H1-type domain-containing protein n=1 Tax=Podospora aff. communis PSN243 TaxID=3040156 RepID=A0AAV9GPH2_9PEZI|nr:hypothetical protein QBC34DRAFT_493973 [Podospora aff. communis PSN243]